MFTELISRRFIAWVLIWSQFLTPLLSVVPSMARADVPAEMQQTIQGLNSLILEQDPASPAPAPSPAPASTPPGESHGYFPLRADTPGKNDAPPALPGLGLPDEAPPQADGAARLASAAVQAGTLLAEDSSAAGINYARSLGEGLINQQINDWLNQYGNARVSVGTQRTFSGDMLVPVYETDSSLFFTQLGGRTNQERNTLNLGLGYRWYPGDWLLGVNAFYDYDLTGKNKRFGIGAEAWRDYLKLSANGYIRGTDWHQSPLKSMEDYDERPANGFDLRVNAYLPSWPQLGGSLKYEQYFGKGVAVTGSTGPDALKNNPSVITAGLDYTPFPLLTLSAKHATGDAHDTSVGVDFTYRFGVPWEQQTRPDGVGLMRSLAGNIYDFVDRNYDIVMQYRKQELIRIALPPRVVAQAAETIPLVLTVAKAKYGLKGVDWQVDPQLGANGGSWQMLSPTELQIKLPAYLFSGDRRDAQEYKISAVATDNHGNPSNTAETVIGVVPSENVVSLSVSPEGQSLAVGSAPGFTLTARATDAKGSPLANQTLSFSVAGLSGEGGLAGAVISAANGRQAENGNITVVTGADGRAVVTVTSTVAGRGTVTVTMDNGNSAAATVSFAADGASAQVSELAVVADNATADGVAANRVRVTVRDKYGNPVSGAEVCLSADNGATTAETVTTGEAGTAEAAVTSRKAGPSVVTASLGGGGKTVTVTFGAGEPARGSSGISTDATRYVAGDDISVSVVLRDAENNAVTGRGHTLNGSAVTVPNAVAKAGSGWEESAPGTYVRVWTATTVGEDLTATLNLSGWNKASENTYSISANQISAVVTSLVIVKDNATADGIEENSVRLGVKDLYDNPVSGASVALTASNGARIADSVLTLSDGTAEIALTSIKAGLSKVTASLNDNSQSVEVTFVSGKPASGTSTVSLDKTSYIAGTEIEVTVTLKDAQGNMAGGQAAALANAVTVPNAEAKVGSSWTETGGTGIYVRTYLAKTAGENLTATLNLSDGTQHSGVYSITAGAAIHANSGITLDKTSYTAGADMQVTVTLKDAQGNMANGQAAMLADAVNVPNAEAKSGSGWTESSTAGIYTRIYLAKTAGENLKAMLKLADGSQTSGAYSIVAGAAAQANSAIAVDRANYTAGMDIQVTVTLKDSNNNAASGQAGALAARVTVANAEAKPGSNWTENGNPGVYTRTYLAKTTGEKLAATLNLVDGQQTSNLYNITAGTATAASSAIAVDKAGYTADTDILVTVMLKDEQGNQANGQAAILTDAVTVPNAEAKAGSSWAETSTPGSYTRTYLAKTAGENLKATLRLADGNQTSNLYSITAGVAVQTNSGIAVDKDSYTAGTEMLVTVVLKDSNGNAAPGQSSTLAARVTVANAEAQAGSSWTESSTAGTYTRAYVAQIAGENLKATLKFSDGNRLSGAYSITAGAAAQASSSIAVGKNSYIAGAEMQVSVVLNDTNGNRVTGQSQILADRVSVAHAEVKPGSGWMEESGSPGLYSRTYLAKTAGENLKATLTLSDGEVESGTYSITAGEPAKATSAITVDKDSYVADSEMQVTVTLKDSNNNSVSGLSNLLASSVTVANAEVKPGSDWTEKGNSGIYTRAYVAKTAGTGLKATLELSGWNGEVASGIYIITADSDSAKVSSVTLNGNIVSKVANGSNSFSYTVTVIDSNGNPVAGAEVMPSAADNMGAGIQVVAESKTNASGQTTITLTSSIKAAYDIMVSAKAGTSASVNADKTVSFIADNSTAQVSTVALIGDVVSKVADGNSRFSYRVTVVDGNGNPVPEVEIAPAASDSDNVRVAAEGKTDASGQAIITLTSSTKASYDILVSAKAGTTPAVDADKKVSFTADSNTAQVSRVALIGDVVSKVANGSNSFSYTVIVVDGNGNAVPGMEVTPAASDSENVRVAAEGKTDASGQTTITLTSSTKASYDILVSAKTGTAASASADKKVSFTADNATAQVSTVTLIGDVVSKVANGSNSFSYTVIVVDGNGNPVPGVEVIPAASDSENVRVAAEGETDASGQTTIVLTSGTKTSSDILVSAKTGTTSAVDADKKVSFTADSNTAQVGTIVLNDDVQEKIANGSNSFSYTVTVVDGNGNPLSGMEVTPAVTGYDSEYTRIAINGKTNASGQATITLTSTTRASYDMTVSATAGLAASVNADKEVSFIADISTARVGWVILNDDTLSKVANGTDSFSFTAQLVDGYGNWIVKQSGYTIKWMQDKGAQVNLPESSQIDKNGQAIVEMTSTHLVNDIQVSAQYLATASVNADKRVSFIRGAVAKVTLAMVNGGNEAVASKETNYPLVISVEDAYGHKIPNQQLNLSVSGSAGGKPGIYPASVSSDANGAIATRPEVGDTTAETVTVTAVAKGTDVKGVLDILFKAGAVSTDRSTIKASPASIKADNQSTSTLIFVPRDEFGNIITDLNTSAIASAITGMSATAIKLSGWSYSNNQYTATATAGTSTGSLLVIPVVNGVDAISRKAENILALTAGDIDISQSSIKAFPASIAANGKQTSLLQFTPKDKYGNLIDYLTVASLSQVITGTATDLTVGAWSYNKVNSYYQAILTAGTTAGTANIMPTLNGADAAAIGVTDTLSLVNNSSVSRIEIDSATTDLAVADGKQVNYVRFNFYGKDGNRLTGVRFTITPGNPEMAINENFAPVSGTSNQDGQGAVNIASTLSGNNDFIIEADGFGERFNTTFSTYVSPGLSGITFDKRNLLNNGTDKMTVTFRPVDALGRLVEGLKVGFSSTDTAAALTTSGYKTVVSSKSTTSTYFLTVKMENYSLWQPDMEEYYLIPPDGIRLGVLSIAPILCGGLTYHSGYVCTPTAANNEKYIASGLGFYISLVDKSDNWDGKIRLTSDTVDGAVYLYSLDGKSKQNCSVPVSESQSWMNDYGKTIGGVANTLEFDFAAKKIANTVGDIGFIEPPGSGGGIGHCSIDDAMKVNVTLQGSGNVKFTATTTSPASKNYFNVPVGNKRIDAGALESHIVNIYSN